MDPHPVYRTSATTHRREHRTNRNFLFFVPVHRVTGYHSPTPTSRCVRCVVLASSPSRRRPRSDIPMRVVASSRRASRVAHETKNKKNKNKTYLGGSLGDERRGGDGASGGGRNGERHRRTCASCVVTSAPQGPCAQKASVGVHFASHDPSRKKKRTSFPPRLALAVWCCLWMCVCTNSICGCVVVEISGAAFRLWALG